MTLAAGMGHIDPRVQQSVHQSLVAGPGQLVRLPSRSTVTAVSVIEPMCSTSGIPRVSRARPRCSVPSPSGRDASACDVRSPGDSRGHSPAPT